MTCIPQDKCISYIEFRVSDIKKTKDFYGKIFGWTFTDYSPEYCEFTDGHMKGGFEEASPQAGGPLIVLYGKDLDGLAQAVQNAGATITKPNFEFPGGRRFEFKDLDGYNLAVWSEA